MEYLLERSPCSGRKRILQIAIAECPKSHMVTPIDMSILWLWAMGIKQTVCCCSRLCSRNKTRPFYRANLLHLAVGAAISPHTLDTLFVPKHNNLVLDMTYHSTTNLNISLFRFVILGCVLFSTMLLYFKTEGVYILVGEPMHFHSPYYSHPRYLKMMQSAVE